MQRLVTVSERAVDTVVDRGAVFPAPEGYNLVHVDAMLDGKPLRFSCPKYFL